MCEIEGEKMDAATRDAMRGAEVMAKALRGFDSLFGPALARAEAQSRKIAEAARICREVEDDDDPWTTQP